MQGQDKEQPDVRECRRRLGTTTRQVLDILQKEDYIGNIKEMLDLAHQSVDHHVDKLQDLGLVKETAKVEGRQYYLATDKGREAIDGVNVPSY